MKNIVTVAAALQLRTAKKELAYYTIAAARLLQLHSDFFCSLAKYILVFFSFIFYWSYFICMHIFIHCRCCSFFQRHVCGFIQPYEVDDGEYHNLFSIEIVGA